MPDTVSVPFFADAVKNDTGHCFFVHPAFISIKKASRLREAFEGANEGYISELYSTAFALLHCTYPPFI